MFLKRNLATMAGCFQGALTSKWKEGRSLKVSKTKSVHATILNTYLLAGDDAMGVTAEQPRHPSCKSVGICHVIYLLWRGSTKERIKRK